jgi:catechol 2,3-dioxygenase-like lactoylglutathione lyase family enzyme
MIDHFSIAVSDLPAARQFYDAVLAEIGIARVGETTTALLYGARADADHPDRIYMAVQLDPNLRHASTRRHWSFKAPRRLVVDAFYAAGLAAGGAADGAPGLRPHYHPAYYAAFLLDPDGNRIEIVCHHRPGPAGA